MNKIKALIIHPKTPQTFWSHESALKAAGFKTIMPPLGLMTIAVMLPNHYHMTLMDLNV